MTAKKAKLVRAVTSFTADVEGTDVLVHAGDLFPGDHPVVKGREELFEPA